MGKKEIEYMQIDLFGNEIPLSEMNIESSNNTFNTLHGGRITLKSKFRYNYGFKEGCYCKNCQYFEEHYNRCKKYFKCQKLGVSSSIATDIRKNDIACNLYKEVSHEV